MIFTVRKDKEPSQSKQFDPKVFAKKLNINKADNQNFLHLVFSLQHAYLEIKSIRDTLEQLVHHESAVLRFEIFTQEKNCHSKVCQRLERRPTG
jgi:hypothetical protein